MMQINSEEEKIALSKLVIPIQGKPKDIKEMEHALLVNKATKVLNREYDKLRVCFNDYISFLEQYCPKYIYTKNKEKIVFRTQQSYLDYYETQCGIILSYEGINWDKRNQSREHPILQIIAEEVLQRLLFYTKHLPETNAVLTAFAKEGTPYIKK